MSKFPAVFVSHGAPDLSLHPSPARTFLSQLGNELGKPQAILMISAHWGTREPMVSKVEKPNTVHDFWGFDPKLNSINYQALGAPDLARQVSQLLDKAGIRNGVTQLSIQPRLTPEHHLQLGKALAPLRELGISIIASGSATHNLREFRKYPIDALPPVWVTEFSNWLSKAIYRGDIESLLNYRKLAPYAIKNHPTADHLFPLFVALGAGGNDRKELHYSYTYGVLSMAAYAFE